MAVSMTSCYDDYKKDHENMYVGFTMQRPYIPLVESDKDVLSLDAGVVITGRYEQDKKWSVDYQIDESLLGDAKVLSDAANESKYAAAFELLPADYYTVSNESEIVIPVGDILGRVTFSIDKAKFMNDPKALAGKYVLPLSVSKCDAPAEILEEKSFAVLALTYLNKYHGEYWVMGKDVREDGNEVVYIKDADEMVKNKVISLKTTGMNTVKASYVGRFDSAGNTMTITVNDDNTLSIAPAEGSNIAVVSGSGTFNAEDREFSLNYTYTDSEGMSHTVTDTLVFIKVLNADQRVVDWEGVLVK